MVARKMKPDDSKQLVLIDTHVHYYPFCDLAKFLDCAWDNMRRSAAELGCQSGFAGVLCMMETQGTFPFSELMQMTEAMGSWRIRQTHDGKALVAESAENAKVYLVPGHQVVTQENLELLIIGKVDVSADEDSFSLRYYLEQYSDRYFIIIPWGVGKWLGWRGRVVSEAIQELANLEFALGDNSCRPRLWEKVPQFDIARKQGRHIFPGSDPLPLIGQQSKVGSYGIAFFCDQPAENAVADLRKTMLGLSGTDMRVYGTVDGLYDFFRNQFLLRLTSKK